MTIAGVGAIASVETSKLAAQHRTRLALAACLLGPFVFAAAIRVQSALPTDTLFGRSVKESGFAIALVVLGFAALWAFPVLASVVGGDVFAAEDRYGTWKTVLTRSRSRAEVFTGKVLVALAFSSLAVIFLDASSIGAGIVVVGSQPLIDLSGVLLAPSTAAVRVGLAWASVLPAALAVTALAIVVSIATRSSAAGIGLPVLIASIMQLSALVDGPEIPRRLLITSSFTAWHGLLAEPSYYGPIVHGTVVSGIYVVVCLTIAYRLMHRRDVGG
jgi:ABC-2 type transport system permease protein